jgi:flagellar assembly protein FliH
MSVLKQTSPRASVAVGGVFDLSDLRGEAERAVVAARAEAARIVDEARREAARLQAEAQRAGFAKGEAEGLAKGREDGLAQGAAEGLAAARTEHAERLATIEHAFAEEFVRWMGTRDEVMRGAERELAGVAIAMAESIVREHVRVQPDVVARAVEAAIGLFARATRVTIEVAPEDAPLVAEAMPQLAAALPEGAAVSIVQRAGIARGGCVIRSSEGSVDARIETQFRRLREGLLGAGSAADASTGLAEDGGGGSPAATPAPTPAPTPSVIPTEPTPPSTDGASA